MLGLIISAIVVGLIIGALGRLVLPGRQNISIWLTIAIGVAAALIGSLIASALGVGDTRGIDWIKLIIPLLLRHWARYWWLSARSWAHPDTSAARGASSDQGPSSARLASRQRPVPERLGWSS